MGVVLGSLRGVRVDPVKAAANVRKHGVSFEAAARPCFSTPPRSPSWIPITLQTRSEQSRSAEEGMKRHRSELRAEYDLESLKGVVRGKYYQRAMAGTNLVLLEADVARAFPDSNSVNRALRLLRDVATQSAGRARKAANGRRKATG
jgi:hypothetical protein